MELELKLASVQDLLLFFLLNTINGVGHAGNGNWSQEVNRNAYHDSGH